MLSNMSTKESTKSKFEQLLKAALEDAKTEKAARGKKVKKKKKRSPEVGLVSATHDEYGSQNILEQETEFNGSDKKKLSRRKKIKEGKEGLVNPVFMNDNNSPTKRLISIKEVDSKDNDIIRSSSDTTQEIIKTVITPNEDDNRNDATLYSAIKPRKKKSPKPLKSPEKSLLAEEQNCDTTQVEEEIKDERDSTSPRAKLKPRPVRRKKLRDSTSKASHCEIENDDEEEAKHGSKERKDGDIVPKALEKSLESTTAEDTADNKILSVKVHRVSRLKMNFLIRHPLVRVHIVNGSTGMCIKKKDSGKSVTLVYENKSSNLDYILPVMTQPYDLKQQRSTLPVWEEELLFNESFDYFTQEGANTILFFEILDFLPMSVASAQYVRQGVDSGWYHIAWAFLKLIGANGALNVDRKVQLQLYCPPKQHIRPEPHVIDVFHWWSSLPRIAYPGTLYVTVSGIDCPRNMTPALRSLAPMQEEASLNISRSSPGYNNEKDDRKSNSEAVLSTTHSAIQWSRLPGQSCKVPNCHFLTLPTSSKGCFTASFSQNGRSLACGCYNGVSSVIIIYEIPSGETLRLLNGHVGLIYELQFADFDRLLVSAAADGTARLWCLEGQDSKTAVILPHPSFVYTAQFHPRVSFVIVTGCYDTLIRVWNANPEVDKHGQLIQELEGHEGFVNSLCFDEDGTKLYSGDSKGIIRVWNVYVTVHPAHKGVTDNWSLYQEIRNAEFQGVSISKLIHHPNMKRLLIQCADGVLRMADSQTFNVFQHFKGHLNVCELLKGCISPCGTYLFTGSEDHYVYVWNTITGDEAAVYSDLPQYHTIHGVAFHPHDHIVAFCSSGYNVPVILYKYSSKVVNVDVSRVIPKDTVPSSVSLTTSVIDNSFINHLPTCDRPPSGRRSVTFNLTDTNSSTYLEKILHKLDSVLVIPKDTLVPSDTMPNGSLNSLEMSRASWGSTFDGLGMNPNAVTIGKAVALHEYNPQRSDELKIRKGDEINILHKESDQWYIGKLLSGEIGYIPKNYVTLIVEDPNRNAGIDREVNELELNEKAKDVTAVITRSGQLAFISASEDEEPIMSSTPKRHKSRHRRRNREKVDVFDGS